MFTSKKIALYAMSFALLLTARLIDQVLSNALPINMAYFTIIVGLALVFLQSNYVESLIVGFLFGLSSFTLAWFFPTYFGKLFMNPLVSIIPRMLVGISVFSIFRLLNYVMNLRSNKNSKRKYVISASIASGLGALLNTALVLGSMYVLGLSDGKGYFALISGVFLTNALPELLLSIFVTPLVAIKVANALRIDVCGIAYPKEAYETN